METVEVLPVKEGRIAALVNEFGVEESTAIALRDSFAPIEDLIAAPLAEAASIKVTDASQKKEMQRAYDLRQVLKKARTSCEKLRVELKEDSLRYGKAVQGVANRIKALIEPAEEYLLAQEEFAKRQEAQRKAEAKIAREAALAPYGVDLQFINLLDMSDAQFASLLETSRLAYEGRLAAAKKAEEERIAAMMVKAQEDARIRAENAKLKAAADAADVIAAKERAAAKAEQDRLQAIADNERFARLKAEKAEAERLAAEQAKQKAEAAKAKKAASAPDADKVRSVMQAIAAITTPQCSTVEGINAMEAVNDVLKDAMARINRIANTLA